jgi:uracil-DNA glycosylase
MSFEAIRQAIIEDADNVAVGAQGYLPLYAAGPRARIAGRWHPPLLQLMPDIQLAVLVGSYAQTHYLGARAQRNLTETVHAFRDYLPDLIPVAHPSPLNFHWQARNPWFAADLLPVLQQRVAAVIG